MTQSLTPVDRLVVALDVPTRQQALALARQLQGRVGMLKVGLELFCAEGAGFIKELQAFAPVFLDLKLHDIPNTVRRALETLLPLDVRLINIHAQGGPAMIEAAAEAVQAHRKGGGRTQLLAVTVLTSLDREALARLGMTAEPEEMALHLARLSQECGADGVVCSAREAALVKASCGEDFHRLTPGIRPKGTSAQDQSRVLTPEQALRNGATWLVVGRPITQSPDPAAAADAILAEIALC
jgi:orotidine-5'-phosphate decarboxylase